MPYSPSLAALLGGRAVPPPARVRFSRGHALRLSCATAAGCASVAGLGLGRFKKGSQRSEQHVARAKTSAEFGHPSRRMTDSLLVINALMFALQIATKERVTVWGIKDNASILNGQWWRLITPTFLHGNIVHLAVNSMALNNLGPLVEAVSGRRRYLSVYAFAAVAGVAGSCFGSPRLGLGSSGAIFGVGGALAVFVQRHKEYFGPNGDRVLGNLGENLAINIAYGLVATNVDNWAHMAGLLGGALAAYLLGPRIVDVYLPGNNRAVKQDRPPLGIFATQLKPDARLSS